MPRPKSSELDKILKETYGSAMRELVNGPNPLVEEAKRVQEAMSEAGICDHLWVRNSGGHIVGRCLKCYTVPSASYLMLNEDPH